MQLQSRQKASLKSLTDRQAGSGSQYHKGDNLIMTYRDSLSPWAIVRLLPNNLQWVIIARYRNRSDADGHLQLLRRRVPQ
ncbi:MAG: hypothetical protein WA919_24680, partial [Coleofasciculaceae cyanobacterium]